MKNLPLCLLLAVVGCIKPAPMARGTAIRNAIVGGHAIGNSKHDDLVWDAATGDINGDGRPDLVLALGGDRNRQSLRIHLGCIPPRPLVDLENCRLDSTSGRKCHTTLPVQVRPSFVTGQERFWTDVHVVETGTSKAMVLASTLKGHNAWDENDLTQSGIWRLNVPREQAAQNCGISTAPALLEAHLVLPLAGITEFAVAHLNDDDDLDVVVAMAEYNDGTTEYEPSNATYCSNEELHTLASQPSPEAFFCAREYSKIPRARYVGLFTGTSSVSGNHMFHAVPAAALAGHHYRSNKDRFLPSHARLYDLNFDGELDLVTAFDGVGVAQISGPLLASTTTATDSSRASIQNWNQHPRLSIEPADGRATLGLDFGVLHTPQSSKVLRNTWKSENVTLFEPKTPADESEQVYTGVVGVAQACLEGHGMCGTLEQPTPRRIRAHTFVMNATGDTRPLRSLIRSKGEHPTFLRFVPWPDRRGRVRDAILVNTFALASVVDHRLAGIGSSGLIATRFVDSTKRLNLLWPRRGHIRHFGRQAVLLAPPATLVPPLSPRLGLATTPLGVRRSLPPSTSARWHMVTAPTNSSFTVNSVQASCGDKTVAVSKYVLLRESRGVQVHVPACESDTVVDTLFTIYDAPPLFLPSLTGFVRSRFAYPCDKDVRWWRAAECVTFKKEK